MRPRCFQCRFIFFGVELRSVRITARRQRAKNILGELRKEIKKNKKELIDRGNEKILFTSPFFVVMKICRKLVQIQGPRFVR